MDVLETVGAGILIRALDAIGYGLGMLVLALAMFAAGSAVYYVLRWMGAFKTPPSR